MDRGIGGIAELLQQHILGIGQLAGQLDRAEVVAGHGHHNHLPVAGENGRHRRQCECDAGFFSQRRPARGALRHRGAVRSLCRDAADPRRRAARG